MTVHEGFAGYREFAPPGWSPPPLAQEVEWLRGGLPDPDVWCVVGERDGEIAGHVAFRSAGSSRWGDGGDAGLAHLWQVFVRPAHWGTGLAPTLLAAATERAGERGFARMRLYTPAGQARARRFYEREGWTARGEPFEGPQLGLAVLEYRRPL